RRSQFLKPGFGSMVPIIAHEQQLQVSAVRNVNAAQGRNSQQQRQVARSTFSEHSHLFIPKY
ncbi:MAG: hypothetical protein ABGZ24_21710, partial [Fuerstiella sp.]